MVVVLLREGRFFDIFCCDEWGELLGRCSFIVLYPGVSRRVTPDLKAWWRSSSNGGEILVVQLLSCCSGVSVSTVRA